MTTDDMATEVPLHRHVDQDAQITVLVDLLVRGLRGLGGAGQIDLAGRLAGRAWSVLRIDHPRAAERINGLLHYLARLPASEVPPIPNPSTEENTMTTASPELDVRQEIPARRHELIFDTYRALAAGENFVLVNDHDPKPLYYQFAAEHTDQFTWDYLEEGPEVWKVRIGRVAS